MRNVDEYKTWCIQLCVHVKYTLNKHVIIILCGKKKPQTICHRILFRTTTCHPATLFGQNRSWYKNPSPRRRRLTRTYGHSRVIQHRSVYNNYGFLKCAYTHWLLIFWCWIHNIHAIAMQNRIYIGSII